MSDDEITIVEYWNKDTVDFHQYVYLSDYAKLQQERDALRAALEEIADLTIHDSSTDAWEIAKKALGKQG